MAPQLPWELEEEILSRLPPKSLGHFRIVCKRWNRVCEDKTFQNNHLSRSRPQFILLCRSKIYSIDIINPNSIDPKLESRELHSTPITPGGLRYSRTTNCDELLFCDEWSGGIRRTVLCNPWLRQTKRIFNIEYFEVFGIGYDNSGPEKVYKILGYSSCRHNEGTAIYDCASHALKFIDQEWIKRETAKGTIVSLNGNLYWITLDDETREHIIQCFDFPTERIKPLCLVPYQTNHPLDVLHLAVFKRDGFCLLKQCNETRKVEVWLTNKVDEEELVWIKLMTLTSSSLPRLFNYLCSYFVYDKTLFMYCGYNNASIYIMRGDTCKKIQIRYGSWILEYHHCVSTPSLFSVPLFSG